MNVLESDFRKKAIEHKKKQVEKHTYQWTLRLAVGLDKC